jgi:hypothetical protein
VRVSQFEKLLTAGPALKIMDENIAASFDELFSNGFSYTLCASGDECSLAF